MTVQVPEPQRTPAMGGIEQRQSTHPELRMDDTARSGRYTAGGYQIHATRHSGADAWSG